MNKGDAIRTGRGIAKRLGCRNARWLVISENTRTGEHFVLAGYPERDRAEAARAKWEREYRENPFGAQPYMRVTVEKA